MEIKLWQFFAFGDHSIDALEIREQRFQLCLHLQNNLRTECGNQRHIAHELNGVAQTLFGIEQDRFTFYRLLAQPERLLWEITWDRPRSIDLPAPLVFFPALLKIARTEQSEGPVPVHARGFRRNRQRLIE